MTTIAIDAMGGDHGPPVTVPATIACARENPHDSFVLVGIEADIHAALGQTDGASNVQVQHATQVVTMDEAPAHALRKKKDSSMRVALNLVRDDAADACLSAGNTGALMATARFVLKTQHGIDRPSLISSIPNLKVDRGHVHMLDLGANVDSPPRVLVQFGLMGSILVGSLEGIEAPRVALLNIGHEDIKGNDVIQEAAQLLRDSDLNFVGFAEGDEIYTGNFDVIVCDGFVGNVALKTSEGLATMIKHLLGEEFQRSPLSKLAGLAAMPVLNRLGRRMDPRRYNGAPLVGLRGTVLKSHGGADVIGFETAVSESLRVARIDLPGRIRMALEPTR